MNKIDSLNWKTHGRDEENPAFGIYLCKYDETEIRFLTFDSVWGWSADFDDNDNPHFVYDWYLEYAEVPDEDMEEVKNELKQIKRKKYFNKSKKEKEFQKKYEHDDVKRWQKYEHDDVYELKHWVMEYDGNLYWE